jgi:hypothetical protein
MSENKTDTKYKALIDALCVDAAGWSQQKHDFFLKQREIVVKHAEELENKDSEKE